MVTQHQAQVTLIRHLPPIIRLVDLIAIHRLQEVTALRVMERLHMVRQANLMEPQVMAHLHMVRPRMDLHLMEPQVMAHLPNLTLPLRKFMEHQHLSAYYSIY